MKGEVTIKTGIINADSPSLNLLVPFKAVVAGIKKENADVYTYTLKLDNGRVLSECRPGRFNMLGLPGVGEAPISLSSIGSGNSFQHTVRVVGRVTRLMERLSVGDEIFVRGPYGRGWPLDEASGGDLLLVAGGLGLAPLRPVIETIIEKRSLYGNVALVFGTRDPGGVIFADELPKWGKHINVIQTVDEVPVGMSWGHNVGLVVEFLGKTGVTPDKTSAFVCGPEIMMRFTARRLLIGGFLPSRLYVSLERRMKCGVAQCGHCQHGHFFVCKDGPVFLYREAVGFPDGLL